MLSRDIVTVKHRVADLVSGTVVHVVVTGKSRVEARYARHRGWWIANMSNHTRAAATGVPGTPYEMGR